MAVHFLGRSAIIGAGLFAAGFRGKELVKGSMGGALVMEASLLAWAMFKRREDLVTVPVDSGQEQEPDEGDAPAGDGQFKPLTIQTPAVVNPNKPPKELPTMLVDPNWSPT